MKKPKKITKHKSHDKLRQEERDRAEAMASEKLRWGFNQAFLYWKDMDNRLTSPANAGLRVDRSVLVELDIFREWFEELGLWRKLGPNAKGLALNDYAAHAKHKKQIEVFIAERKARLRVIEYDEVQTAHKCQQEGTEDEQVDYQWTFLLAGEPQITLTATPGNVRPPHNDPLKRNY